MVIRNPKDTTEKSPTVLVIGDGVRTHETRDALKRMGFTVIESDPNVTVPADTEWQLTPDLAAGIIEQTLTQKPDMLLFHKPCLYAEPDDVATGIVTQLRRRDYHAPAMIVEAGFSVMVDPNELRDLNIRLSRNTHPATVAYNAMDLIEEQKRPSFCRHT